MQQSNLPLYVKRKDETVKLGRVSEFHFGRYFWECLKLATSNSTLVPDCDVFVITAGCEDDDNHSEGSTHDAALAIDMRIRNLVDGPRQLVVYSPRWWQYMILWATTAAVAMPEYTFILERNHLHIQIGTDNIITTAMTRRIPNLYVSKMI